VSDPRDYKVELGATYREKEPPRTEARGLSDRPFLSVHFACCGVYQRIYRDADGKAYRGRCPRCRMPVTFAVGAGGTASRSFIVR
jgi:hypothetical protein